VQDSAAARPARGTFSISSHFRGFIRHHCARQTIYFSILTNETARETNDERVIHYYRYVKTIIWISIDLYFKKKIFCKLFRTRTRAYYYSRGHMAFVSRSFRARLVRATACKPQLTTHRTMVVVAARSSRSRNHRRRRHWLVTGHRRSSVQTSMTRRPPQGVSPHETGEKQNFTNLHMVYQLIF